MDKRRALLLLNRKSKQGQSDPETLAERLSAAGLAVQLRLIDDPGEIDGAIRAAAGKSDLIVLGGGDGTMNSAIEALLDVGLPLAILPLGTANDLARTLELPVDPLEAADLAAQGEPYWVDLGWVNGKHFFNVASIGVSTRMTGELAPEVKRRWGVLSYVMKAFKALRQTESFKAEIICDNRKSRVRAVQIAVGNGRHYGGGMIIEEHASLDDSKLDLYAIEPQSPLRYAAMATTLRSGTQGKMAGVRTMHGKAISIRTRKPLPVNTDGEITTTTPARFRVLPAAMPIIVSADYAQKRRKEVSDVAR